MTLKEARNILYMKRSDIYRTEHVWLTPGGKIGWHGKNSRGEIVAQIHAEDEKIIYTERNTAGKLVTETVGKLW